MMLDHSCRALAAFSSLCVVTAMLGCTLNEPTTPPTLSPTAAVSPCLPITCPTPVPVPLPVPGWYSAFSGRVTITRIANAVVLKSNGIPDHKSPYFPPGHPQHTAYTGTNPGFTLNPNSIVAHSFTFRVPAAPTVAAAVTPTDLGPIGIATNGVPLYNQYAAAWSPLSNESDTFDQYNGHPQADDIYHYHWEPLWLTRASKEALIGVLLDGFPVYGPREGGRLVTSAMLDRAHGHVGATPEFPFGVYHYHATSTFPYLNGSGFAGTPGTVTY